MIQETQGKPRRPSMAHSSATHRRISSSISGLFVGFVVNSVVVGQGYLFTEYSDSPTPHPPFSFIPQKLHTHSFTYQIHYMIVTPDGITHKTTKHISKYRPQTGLDSNRDPSEYKPKSLPFHQPTQWFASLTDILFNVLK